MLGRGNGRASALRFYARHALVIVVVLLVAACSGGGCSSGCSGCGMTPLTRVINPADIIQNAGSARITRSGLDFIAASAPTLASSILSTVGGEYQYPISVAPTSLSGITLSFCPGGASTTSNPAMCELDVEIGRASFQVDAINADSIAISGTLPVKLEDLPVQGSYTVSVLGLSKTLTLTLNVGLGANGSCNSNGSPNESYANIPFSVTIPLVADTNPPRVGYTKIDAANLKVVIGLSQSDIEVCANCDFSVLGIDVNLDSVCNGLTNGIISLAFDALSSTINSEVTTLIDNAVAPQLCTKPDTTGGCPPGSVVDTGSGNCDYAGITPATCLPIELGVDGLLNLGNLLQSISYGTTSQLDFSLAAGGNMIPANVPTIPYASPGFPTQGSAADNTPYSGHTPNGITLGLLSAMVPDPQSSCVPKAANPIPTGIPIPTELEQNSVTPWASTDPPGPQFGLALAGRYLNYAFGSIYNSGALCLGISTDTFAQLNSGILSILAPSIRDLTFEQETAAAAVITRPQTPPTVTIGGGTNPNTDPLLLISLKQFALDFYVFSDDRFVRVMTFTADLTIPVNLSTAVTAANPNGELLPSLGTVTAANGVVTNSELLTENPTAIATGLTGLVGSIVGQVAGSLKPISLASLTSSLGISLTIPPDGIRKLTSGTDDFLGIFGDLALAPAGAIKVKPHPNLVEKTVHPEVMTLATYDATKLPTLHVTFGTETPSAEPVEYTYWIDSGTRSPWSTETDVTIQNQTLFLQGQHSLYVSARQVGVPMSEAETPAVIPYIIDVIPPTMSLQQTAAGASLTAWDYVSDQAHLEARTRVTDAAGNAEDWSAWQPLTSLANIPAPASGSSIGAQVRDQEGNVATSEVALIRGRDDAAAVAGACGCSTPGTSTTLGGREALLLLLSVLGMLLVVRRARRTAARSPSSPLERRASRGAVRTVGVTAAGAALGVGVVVGALSQGCSCGGNGNTFGDGGQPEAGIDGDAGKKDGSKPKPEAATTSGCGTTCNQPCMPALPEGIIGAYTSIAKATDGTIWVAGYDDSAVSQAYMGLYGDLVVGKYDSTKKQVMWATVDGLPDAGAEAGCPLYDPTGWRKGLTDPGADVGLWTSIQLDANDHPIVSYYDSTDAALKFASSPDGVTWTVHTVMSAPNSDIGRYGKMLVVNGVPVVAFLIMEPGVNGKMRSRVEVATSMKATPASMADWTFEDAAVDNDGPCRNAFCASPNVCVVETGDCSPPSTGCGGGGAADAGDAGGGGGGCSGTTMCFGGFDAGPACGTPMASTYIDIYPNAFGDYIAMAPTTSTSNGVGIVVYDRIHGALVQLAKVSGAWEETVLDSETGARAPNPGPDGGITPAETGDVGVGASLFITSTGDWHVSYVNGTTEALQYILVPGGTKQPLPPEVIDNGTTLGGMPYPDGTHIVGDDSFIEVDSMGNVTISYQDATAGTLHVATGTPDMAGTHTWTVLAASQPNEFAGYFSHAVVGTTSSFANFWRTADPTTGDENGNVSFASP